LTCSILIKVINIEQVKSNILNIKLKAAVVRDFRNLHLPYTVYTLEPHRNAKLAALEHIYFYL